MFGLGEGDSQSRSASRLGSVKFRSLDNANIINVSWEIKFSVTFSEI